MQAGPEDVGANEDGSKDHEAHGALGAGGVVLSHGRQGEARVDKGGLDLLGAELVVAETSEGDRVAKVLLEGDGVHEDDEGGDDEEDVLEDTRHGEDNGRGLADEEDDGDVEQEGDKGVGKQGEDSDAVDVGHAHAGNLNEQGDDAVDDGTSRGVVVEGDKGVHLELGGAQHALDHDKTQCLEDDTAALVCRG